jgi:putative glycosyltransferase (TIGR04348 family)
MDERLRIALVTPAPRGTVNGNRHTAERWAAFLRSAGHRVSMTDSWPDEGPRCDLLLALHARRSHASIVRFAERNPGSPVVVALTGTDVYRDIHASSAARRSLQIATRLIVLQPKALEELPRAMQRKTSVVIQSAATRLIHRPVMGRFRFCVIGNLRAEKDPLRALAALAHFPMEPRIELIQIGAALDRALAASAAAASRQEPRYRWLGGVPHARALAWLASSHAMVISSRMEGGANVVCEALRIGTPVLASRIPGNVGLLGLRYPGYFEPGDARALARLMLRTANDGHFYSRLRKALRPLRAMTAPPNEARSLLSAIRLRQSA